MSETKKIAVKPAPNLVVFSDFKDGFQLPHDKVTMLVDTHWVRKRILNGELILCDIKDKAGQRTNKKEH